MQINANKAFSKYFVFNTKLESSGILKTNQILFQFKFLKWPYVSCGIMYYCCTINFPYYSLHT